LVEAFFFSPFFFSMRAVCPPPPLSGILGPFFVGSGVGSNSRVVGHNRSGFCLVMHSRWFPPFFPQGCVFPFQASGTEFLDVFGVFLEFPCGIQPPPVFPSLAFFSWPPPWDCGGSPGQICSPGFAPLDSRGLQSVRASRLACFSPLAFKASPGVGLLFNPFLEVCVMIPPTPNPPGPPPIWELGFFFFFFSWIPLPPLVVLCFPKLGGEPCRPFLPPRVGPSSSSLLEAMLSVNSSTNGFLEVFFPLD